jgi:glycosyltransferase involved in cell wall biosynthesis
MVSVCLASHNGEKFIYQQIISILNQLEDNDELIVSDDGSTDSTIQIITNINDRRIKLVNFIQPVEPRKDSLNFRYATKNFENALLYAKGKYVFLSDQDDIWLPNKKNKMVEKLKKYELVMCNFSIIDEKDKIIKQRYYNKSPISRYTLLNILKSKYLGCCLAFRASLLNKVLPFPDDLIAHDFWIGCISDSFLFIEEPLHLYRRGNNNVSTSTKKSGNRFLYKIEYRMEFYKELLKRKEQIKRNCK